MNGNRLSQTSTTEETDLSTLVKWDQKVNNFESGRKKFDLCRLLFKGRRFAVNRKTRCVVNGRTVVDRLSEKVKNSAQCVVSDRNLNRGTGVHDFHTADKSVGGSESNGSHEVIAKVLGDFAGDIHSASGVGDRDGVVNPWELTGGETAVHNWT